MKGTFGGMPPKRNAKDGVVSGRPCNNTGANAKTKRDPIKDSTGAEAQHRQQHSLSNDKGGMNSDCHVTAEGVDIWTGLPLGEAADITSSVLCREMCESFPRCG